jgi:hypothetical protein
MVTAFFVYGVTRLLVLRFEKGDAYPRCSSYRSDPLGTKAFYEGLGLLPGIEAVRNIEPLEKVSRLSETTLFLFGLQAPQFLAMPQESVKALEQAAFEGGRVVISFVPIRALPTPSAKEKKRGETPQEDTSQEKDEEQEPYSQAYVDLTQRWGVEVDRYAKMEGEASLSLQEKELPPFLPWYSVSVFEPRDPDWQVIYAREGKPVLIEQSYGKGSIVLSSDSFLLSNEAMRSKRYPQLLSWLCGHHRKIVFDETHLGVSESPGIATLLRKYGLAPFFISLIVLFLLAVWKQAAGLVPAFEEEERASINSGKDVFTGFTNLLRRNISPDQILPVCLEEWKRSFTHGRQDRSALLPRIQEVIAADRALPKRNRDPAQAYRKITGLGKRR